MRVIDVYGEAYGELKVVFVSFQGGDLREQKDFAASPPDWKRWDLRYLREILGGMKVMKHRGFFKSVNEKPGGEWIEIFASNWNKD